MEKEQNIVGVIEQSPGLQKSMQRVTEQFEKLGIRPFEPNRLLDIETISDTVVRGLDGNHDGAVSLDEIYKKIDFLTDRYPDNGPIQDTLHTFKQIIEKIFNVIAGDDGLVKKDELKTALQTADVGSDLRNGGVANDGSLSISELTNYVRSIPGVTQLIESARAVAQR
jgi:hypothetical protein